MIRQAVTSPPPDLPLGRSGHFSSSTSAPALRSQVPPSRPKRVLPPLTRDATYFLTNVRCLDEATVAAFAHRLRSHPHGGWLVCPHNAEGDGLGGHEEPSFPRPPAN